MMYYDRRIDASLLSLIAADGPLHWLVEFVRDDKVARLDFRKALGDRSHGSIQLYMGRTSPLDVRWRAGEKVKLVADAKYVKLTPDLFRTVRVEDLAELEPQIRKHLKACRHHAASHLIEGEAVVHAGMMRRYGLLADPRPTVLAVDSEAVIGFAADDSYKLGSAHKAAYTKNLKGDLFPQMEVTLPRKLDVVGVLPCGDVALIEVKDAAGDLLRGVHQAAVHVHRFRALAKQPGSDVAQILNGLIKQKTSVGLIPNSVQLRVRSRPRFVPIIAAPDNQPSWWRSWLEKTRQFIDSTHTLTHIRFWRLSDTGEIEEEYLP